MQLQTAEQIAKQLQVTKPRVYEMARLGIIPCVRMGRQLRFEERAIEEWIDRGGSMGKIQSNHDVERGGKNE